MTRSRSARYEPRPDPGSPAPIVCSVWKRAAFHDVDPLRVVWFGRYAEYCDEAAAELARHCGLTYHDLKEANVVAPVVHFRVFYHRPLMLDEEFEVSCSLLWNEAARLDHAFDIRKKDGTTAARAESTQLIVDATTGEVCYSSVALLVRCRERWRKGEFRWMQRPS